MFFSGPLSSGVTPLRRLGNTCFTTTVFAFEYPSLSAHSCMYRQENGRIHFDFVANGLSDASGALNGDLLEVRYSDRMEHSDFENAVYRRSQ